MKKLLTPLLVLFTFHGLAQKNLTEKAQPIVEEGKRLYQSEMASWFGTDIFLEKYKNRENIGGYFSYVVNGTANCIFFSKAEVPKVIGTISFDSIYNPETAKVDLVERDFTELETEYYQIREIALNELNKNEGGFYKFYNSTRPNIVPLIHGKKKKVYILTAPEESGVVIFGNDYLLTFDKKSKLLEKKKLHKNLMPIEYGKTKAGMVVESTMHSHLPETGDYITATDICTLMLYEKIAKWKSHNVISENYLNNWNCETDTLNVILMSTLEKIDKDREKRNKDQEKEEKK